ncbi:MAG: phosphate signaling complex protein PhoU [Alphaproteobacteria bacterium]|nr:phosphate signaling complex protein PhoU [Alphaproteobacteria bacterium]
MENAHIVSRFDKDLDRIKNRILEMGDLVLTQIAQATDLLQDFDAPTADQLIARDRKVNGMNKTIHSRAERLIALRQPVALDLRAALSPINIAFELERIGDHAKSCAKSARKLANAPADTAAMQIVLDMSALVQAMLADVLRAYNDSDIALAADVRARDIEVDRQNKALFEIGLTSIASSPENAEALVLKILLARNFERVGDHIVNIARHVHQIVTGEDLKASD